jgi:hypothetical protein
MSVGAEKARCLMSLGDPPEAAETPGKFDEKLFTIRL